MSLIPDQHESTHASSAPRGAVLFVHIPKTAGMSLHNSLQARFGHEHSLRFPRSSPEFMERYLQLSDTELDRFRLISGHFELPFWLQRKVGDRVVISLVREPVERFLSAYRYMKCWKQHPRHAEFGHRSLGDYVDDHIRDVARHNVQCRKLCGAESFQDARKMAQGHVDLLGSVEAMGAFTKALGERLGLSLEPRLDNRSLVQSPTRDDLESALLAKLMSSNVEDYKLWAYVMEGNLIHGHA